MRRAPIYIHACGALGPNATDWSTGTARTVLAQDAAPIPLKPLLKARSLQVPRVASRFAELAVLGAHACLRTLPSALAPHARLYLATGLGDVARTDALYYQVMPPSGEVASPAHFATSGNNMAAFFVAQRAGLESRNFTLCADALSFETALIRAVSDLAHGATDWALIGGVDETTVPREFYVRRFALRDDEHIGEGSAWMVLSTVAAGAIAELSAVQIRSDGGTRGALVDMVRAHAQGNARLLTGCRIDETTRLELAAQARLAPADPYLPATGIFPTAAALPIVEACQPPTSAPSVHVNRDDAGRIGLIALGTLG